MPDQPQTIHFYTPNGNPVIACGERVTLADYTDELGYVTCFACRRSPAYQAAQLEATPVKLFDVIAQSPELSALKAKAEGVGVPTPGVVRIEPDTSGPVLFTTAQFLQAAALIRTGPHLHHDIVEERFKRDSVTWARLMLWRWPSRYTEAARPARYWIEPDGTVSMVERCDWITAEEWPAWALTTKE